MSIIFNSSHNSTGRIQNHKTTQENISRKQIQKAKTKYKARGQSQKAEQYNLQCTSGATGDMSMKSI